jgi:hypothetical protein
MSHPKYIVIGDRIYNMKNVTYIECNDDKCTIYDNHRKAGYCDEYTKKRHPTQYQDAYKYWRILKKHDEEDTYAKLHESIPVHRSTIHK